MSGLPGIGQRVPYSVAGQAQRQAHERARAVNLSSGDRAILAAVLDLTTSYSKLADHARAADLARRAGARNVLRPEPARDG